MASSNLPKQMRAATNAARGGVRTHLDKVNAQDPIRSVTSFARGGLESTTQDADERLRMKMQLQTNLQGATPGMTPFGSVQATDADFKLLQQKRYLQEKANFDAWVGENFNTGDPATVKWLQETYPEYFDSREEELMRQAAFATRVRMIQLRGIKNEKDLVLAWGLMTGRIVLDRDWDRIGPSDTTRASNKAAEQNRFTKGLWGPSLFRTTAAKQASSQQTGAGQYGNPFKTTAGQGGQGAGQWTAADQITSGFSVGNAGVDFRNLATNI